MDEDLAGLVPGTGLELHPHPAVAFVAALEAAGHHRIRKGKERGAIPALVGEAVHIQREFSIEHRLQAGPGHIAVTAAIDRITHRHVIGGDALCDRACSPANAKEPTHDLLPRADLRHGSVPSGIKVDLERFMVGIQFRFPHSPMEATPAPQCQSSVTDREVPVGLLCGTIHESLERSAAALGEVAELRAMRPEGRETLLPMPGGIDQKIRRIIAV